MNIEQLNSEFAIADQVQFIVGKGGLPCIKIKTTKASALLSIYAAQVLSYTPSNEPEDLLFISDKAFFQKGKAIRGGVPICWPWFGADTEPPKKPNHGFVRNTGWSVAAVEVLKNTDVKIKLELVDTAETQKIWPYSFYLCLDITIGDALTLELSTRNTGQQTFSITEALHSYIKVGDASQIQVLGLENTEYLDKTKNYVKAHQSGAITFFEETDQIYLNIEHEQIIVDLSYKRKIKIVSSGNHNVVVWNPWEQISTKLSDLENEDYRHFVCIEAANAGSDKIEIVSGDEHKLTTSFSIIN